MDRLFNFFLPKFSPTIEIRPQRPVQTFDLQGALKLYEDRKNVKYRLSSLPGSDS